MKIIKNKFISILLLVCMILCLPLTSYALSGKGTEANPFRISTQNELLLLADFPECHFELENDIVFEGIWEPIAEFSGSLDGKGHIITISDFMDKTNMGFFGNLKGTVKNLSINADEISEEIESGDHYIGLFAGSCSGNIENCETEGKFTVTNTFEHCAAYYSYTNYIGSFTGSCSGSITNCKATVSLIFEDVGKNLNSKYYIGGFCGKLSGYIKNSIALHNSLYISGHMAENLISGGICGTLGGSVEQCANISKTSLYRTYHGGISGSMSSSSSSSIINSMNLPKYTYLGSSVMYAGISYFGGTITNCYSAGGNSTDGYGIASYGTMTNCFYNKDILGNSSTLYGIPKSTLAMKMEMTYTDWDFDTIWGIDESEENPINDGYPYLRVFYENVKNPVTKSSLYALNGNLIIDTKISDSSDNYTLHIAFYDENNRLCDYLAIPNERQLRDVFVVYPDTKNATSAKIFTWYSTGNMEPVSTAETVIIER